jgi:cobalt/nickel transport system permease protein
MHIPDGYLSPVTDGVMLAAALPFWAVALRRVKQTLAQRTVPVLAIFAAFSFVLMMFNIPLPGGTTAHAVGGTLLAIVLGPWEAVLGLSVVLGVQALFFGDGGVLALGANCFNMAIAMPLAGYAVYRLVSGRAAPGSTRRLAGAAAGAYFGINVAAFFTSLELGVQPFLFHTAGGTPLYAPYGMATAFPAIMGGHLLVAGPVEALITGLVIMYLQRSRSPLLEAKTVHASRRGLLWGALVVLALLTPVGLLAPGTAWGEWSAHELQRLGLGFIPQGMAKIQGWWSAPFSGYSLPQMGTALGYILSALLGLALIVIFLSVLSRVLHGHGTARARPAAGGGFLTRNIAGLSQALEGVIVNDDLSRRPGLLQGLDPRVKLLSFVLFITAAGLARSLQILAVMAGLLCALALLSRIPPGLFLKRVLLFIPLFTAVIALPALFITPGQVLWRLGPHLAITATGLTSAALLVIRVTDSLALGMLLILTTPWTKLLATLRWYRMPGLVVTIISMTYRYIFLLLHTTNNMFLARRSRGVGQPSAAANRRWLGQALVTTLSKSQHLSEEVYLAMLARGYRGEALALDSPRMRGCDLAWLGLSLGATGLLLWVNYR